MKAFLAILLLFPWGLCAVLLMALLSSLRDNARLFWLLGRIRGRQNKRD